MPLTHILEHSASLNFANSHVEWGELGHNVFISYKLKMKKIPKRNPILFL